MATVTHTPGPGRLTLENALASLDNHVGKVGWFSSSIYPSGVPVAYVAAIHEFGAPSKNIPPRMGLRGMIVNERPAWSKTIEMVAKLILNGSMTMSGADLLDLIGAQAEASIRKQIASVWSPPLKLATLQARARRSASGAPRTKTGGKPLNDTGYLMASVTHLVETKT